MLEVIKPKILVEEMENGSEAWFTVEPLERGNGITIGNSLRRVLSTVLPGVAIIGVKISGVSHEYSTIEGVREDVMEIVLNLKEIAIKATNLDKFETVTARLVKNEAGIVCAGDIQLPLGIEVTNKSAYICSLDDKASLDMELTIGSGRGYKSAKDNKLSSSPIGYIPIDSFFSPVKAVKYEVSSTRVEQSIDYDKLKVFVKTNGAATAKEVVSLAAKLLNNHLDLFINLVDGMEEKNVFEEVTQEETTQDYSKRSIEELELSVRPLNCLKRHGVFFIDQLINMTEDEMLKVKNLGKKSLEEVLEKLELAGLSLRKKED
ncbi:MAG TPA: DNA-directed RNA polymerase subunit alpha [Clostridia bacterium]|nr:DNA-directed RNA polymerase subunit alpha [Clostridia bacterium]